MRLASLSLLLLSACVFNEREVFSAETEMQRRVGDQEDIRVHHAEREQDLALLEAKIAEAEHELASFGWDGGIVDPLKPIAPPAVTLPPSSAWESGRTRKRRANIAALEATETKLIAENGRVANIGAYQRRSQELLDLLRHARRTGSVEPSVD